MTSTHDSPQLTIRPATPADRPVLERLWLLFRHDLSEVSGALPDPTGQFRRERLDAAFTDPGWRGIIAHLEPGDGAQPGGRLRPGGGIQPGSRFQPGGGIQPGDRVQPHSRIRPGDPVQPDNRVRPADVVPPSLAVPTPPVVPPSPAVLPSPVGFALVRAVDTPTRVLNSFFVVRGARRSGVGRRLAAQVLASFPGRWEIAFQDDNPPAVRFWRKVATDAVGQEWTEEHRAVPGRPDLPPDTWISFTTR